MKSDQDEEEGPSMELEMELRVNYSPETEHNIDVVKQFNLMEKLAGPQVCNCYILNNFNRLTILTYKLTG